MDERLEEIRNDIERLERAMTEILSAILGLISVIDTTLDRISGIEHTVKDLVAQKGNEL